ncbi:MAG: GNAT family N-acetyltransferase [Oscillospiraceae bacterium]|nr:GNAT family N-acetyltransferase [Oscillospiraceae bacterium]
MAADAAALGADEAARIYVDGLKTLHYDSDWWRLAYQGDDLVGLIVPQRLGDTVGAINYIGVLPERRGRGHVNALLAEGTRVLTEHGVKKIYADIDTANEPMARALEGMGYVFQTAEVVLVRGV